MLEVVYYSNPIRDVSVASVHYDSRCCFIPGLHVAVCSRLYPRSWATSSGALSQSANQALV